MDKVTHCICFNLEIKDIVKIAKREGYKSSKDIFDNMPCGSRCGMCVEYIIKEFNKFKKT